MNCPRCDPPTSILETRKAEAGAALRRRRECSDCGHRFTTYERAVPETLQVIKRDGRRQPFDRDKLLGASTAPLTSATSIRGSSSCSSTGSSGEVRDSGGELSAERIGELCLDGLERLDRGAYLQFAGTLPEPRRSCHENPRK